MLMGLYIFLHIVCLILLGHLFFWIDYIHDDDKPEDRDKIKKVITIVFLLGPFAVALFCLALVLYMVGSLINYTIKELKRIRK